MTSFWSTARGGNATRGRVASGSSDRCHVASLQPTRAQPYAADCLFLHQRGSVILCRSSSSNRPEFDGGHMQPGDVNARVPYDHPELQEGELHYLSLPTPYWQNDSEHAAAIESKDSSSSRSSSDMLNSLMRNRFWNESPKPPIDLLDSWSNGGFEAQEVHVIAFTCASSESEGIYTLRTLNLEGLPQDTVVGFQSLEDADRYACLLEASMEPHTPRVTCLAVGVLIDFCRELGYRCLVEQAGSLVVPPENNVESTDWERCIRLRHGQYEVLDQASYESIRGGSSSC